MTIDQFCSKLRGASIQGVDFYERRLCDNEGDLERIEDFACEGYVALAFAKHDWAITMRESPDLEGRLGGIYLGIEVKHFRYKPTHDPIEDAALRSWGETLARIPMLSETEGREDAWDQMFRFAKKNAHQYVDGEFNAVFFWCSTQAHFDATLTTAVNIYDEAIQEPSCDPGMMNLTAMMMNGVWARAGDDARSIFWRPIRHARKPITPELGALLDVIRYP
ncbi:MAG: hypothetical protein ACLQKA_04300 [Bryobacteraceae bacterium]